MVGKSGPSFCQELHTKNGLDLLLAHGHGPVGLAKTYLIFYPLQFVYPNQCKALLTNVVDVDVTKKDSILLSLNEIPILFQEFELSV